MKSPNKRSVGVIKNPLTVISVFAGLAEVSATIALPQLSLEMQAIFVWFVMLFPTFLVALFFIFLWNKHHVLYAPSDYENEDNFMKIWIPSGKPIMDELEAIEDETVENGDAPQSNEVDNEVGTQKSSLGEQTGSDSSSRYSRIAEYRLAEDLAVQWLTNKFKAPFHRDVELHGRKGMGFDAVAETEEGLLLVEVKVLKNSKIIKNLIRKQLERASLISNYLENHKKKSARLMIVFVLDGDSRISDDEVFRIRKWTNSEVLECKLPITVGLEFLRLEDLKNGLPKLADRSFSAA